MHYARAWAELKRLAELLAAPVATSLGGKSAFPENHPLALGSGGNAIPAPVHHFLQEADLIFGIGCSFTRTNFGVDMPAGKAIIHATLDPMDVNKDVACEHGAARRCQAHPRRAARRSSSRMSPTIGTPPRSPRRSRRCASPGSPSGCRSLPRTRRRSTPTACSGTSRTRSTWSDTIVTHDAGSPRDQLSPFWVSTAPLSYIGWGKTTQLGYGLGLAMGAKLVHPEKLCINVWGDAAIGFTGMDVETAVRERIPILSILLNNFCMAIELKVLPVATERYRATDISGDYAAMARAFGAYGERITEPAEIVPAIRRGIAATEQGQPALLEFITSKEVAVSKFK